MFTEDEINAILQDAEDVSALESLLGLPRIKRPLPREETHALTQQVWDLGERCRQILEQDIVPTIPGGAEALLQAIDANRAADIMVPSRGIVVSVVQEIPEDEEYKLGYSLYQLAFQSALFESLDVFITTHDHPAYAVYQELKQRHEERHAHINTLTEHNLALVASLAKRRLHPAFDIQELINEGGIALLESIDRYNPHKGAELSTFVVPKIHWRMSSMIQQYPRTVRLPSYVTAILKRMIETEAALMQRLEREPTAAEIAAELGISEEEVRERLSQARGAVSLNALLRGRGGEETETTVGDLISDPRAEADFTRIFADQGFSEAISELPDQERRIIELRYVEGMTLQAIGDRLGFSREWISQLEDRALRQLRITLLTRGRAER